MEVVPILHNNRPAYQVVTVPTRRRRRARRRTVAADTADPRGRSHLSNKTAEDRVLEYGTELFRSSGELLLCQFCDKPVDPRRRSSIEYHLKSFSHQRKVRSLTAGSPLSSEGAGEGAAPPGDEPELVPLGPDSVPARDVRTADGDVECVPCGVSVVCRLLFRPEAMKVDPSGGSESPMRPGDWGALLNGQHSSAALSQMSLLMAEGVASSLCEAQLADEGSSAAAGSGTVFTGGGEAERRCCCHCSCAGGGVPRKEGNTFPNELVVKVRVSDSPERHFVLVDLPTSDLSWLRLVAASCAALGIPVKMVKEVLKLPNTLLVRDKDVKRLLDYQELELILHNA
ncbi:Ankyrin repeat domain-containing protein 40 [Amphibalanus amphitrite]|uniref:Ankyrin repeat domain-containing protein 40 n=1 Tax=Amphibalanus amphitrite TaxID=1232801 RepID=A0A6A4VS37_AMPAM|nr:Ankyrin repeat domain-containing protein 40 [Amphibalanus amphitrite]